MLPRVIPILLLRGQGLYKGTKFTDEVYIGDPVNTIRIFNEKEVDELIVLDIDASPKGKPPDIEYLRDLASECFMPLCYGGGIKSLLEIEGIMSAGLEKVALNSVCFENPEFVREASRIFGSQAIVVSMDVRKGLLGGSKVYKNRAAKKTSYDPVEYAKRMEDLGAGELLLTSVDREGTLSGYDTDLVGAVSDAVGIPVVASGGARDLQDISAALRSGASAVGAGCLFVFHGKHRAVLITYPERAELERVINER